MSTSLGEFMHVFPVPTWLRTAGVHVCVHTRALARLLGVECKALCSLGRYSTTEPESCSVILLVPRKSVFSALELFNSYVLLLAYSYVILNGKDFIFVFSSDFNRWYTLNVFRMEVCGFFSPLCVIPNTEEMCCSVTEVTVLVGTFRILLCFCTSFSWTWTLNYCRFGNFSVTPRFTIWIFSVLSSLPSINVSHKQQLAYQIRVSKWVSHVIWWWHFVSRAMRKVCFCLHVGCSCCFQVVTGS